MKLVNKKFFLIVLLLVCSILHCVDIDIYTELKEYVDEKLSKNKESDTLHQLLNMNDKDIKNKKKPKLILASKDYINCMKEVKKGCKEILIPFHVDDEKLFNVFEVDKYSNKNSLVIAGLLAVSELKVKTLITNMQEYINYLHAIQSMYRNIPYQNRNHPAELLFKLIFWIRKLKESGVFKKGPIFNAFIEETEHLEDKKERLEMILTITGHDSFFQGLNEKEVCDPSYNYNLNKNSGSGNNLTKIICKAVNLCNSHLFAVNEKISSFVTYRLLSKFNFYKGQDSKDTYKTIMHAITDECGQDISKKNGYIIDEKNFIHSLIISTTKFIENNTQEKFIEKPDTYNHDKKEIYQLFMNALDNSFSVSKNPALSMRLSMQILCQEFSSHYYKKFTENNNLKVLVSNHNIFDFILDRQSKTILRMKLFYSKIDEMTKNVLRLKTRIVQNYHKMVDTLNYELSKYNSEYFKFFKICVKNNYVKDRKNIYKLDNDYLEFVNRQSQKVGVWKKRIDHLKLRKEEENTSDENEKEIQILTPEFINVEYEEEDHLEESEIKKHFLK